MCSRSPTASLSCGAGPRSRTRRRSRLRRKRSPDSSQERSVPPDQDVAIHSGHAAIADVVGIKEQTLLKRVLISQPFWVAVALLVLAAIMSAFEPSFATPENAGNVARNFSPFGIMALGMTV